MKKAKFLQLFEIADTSFTPNYDDYKYFQLDHIFLMLTQVSEKKVTILDLEYDPYHYRMEPPATFTGKWRCYSVIGMVSSEANLVDGVKQGKEYIYYDDGRTCWDKTYKDGKLIEIKSVNSSCNLGEKNLHSTNNLDSLLKRFPIH